MTGEQSTDVESGVSLIAESMTASEAMGILASPRLAEFWKEIDAEIAAKAALVTDNQVAQSEGAK